MPRKAVARVRSAYVCPAHACLRRLGCFLPFPPLPLWATSPRRASEPYPPLKVGVFFALFTPTLRGHGRAVHGYVRPAGLSLWRRHAPCTPDPRRTENGNLSVREVRMGTLRTENGFLLYGGPPKSRPVQKTGVYLYANRDRRVLAVSDEDPLRPVSHLFLCLYGVPRTTKERTTGRPPAQSPPGRSRFRGFRSHLDAPPAPHDILKHSPLPGVSLFGKTCSYLHKQQGRYDSMFIPPILQPSSLDD